jgi:hypothetical protein
MGIARARAATLAEGGTGFYDGTGEPVEARLATARHSRLGDLMPTAPAGVYFYRMDSGAFRAERKMVVLP